RTQMPLKWRFVVGDWGRVRLIVIFWPRSWSKGMTVGFSAMRSSWKAKSWEMASWPAKPTRRRSSGPSGVVTVIQRSACLYVAMCPSEDEEIAPKPAPPEPWVRSSLDQDVSILRENLGARYRAHQRRRAASRKRRFRLTSPLFM